MFIDEVIEYKQTHYCSCGKRLKEITAFAVDRDDVHESLVFQDCCRSCRSNAAMISDFRKKRTIKGI